MPPLEGDPAGIHIKAGHQPVPEKIFRGQLSSEYISEGERVSVRVATRPTGFARWTFHFYGMAGILPEMELIPLAVFWFATFEIVRLLGLFRGETRRSAYSLAFGVWAIVAIYAVLHDQYLVCISPGHFTIFHDPFWGIGTRRPRLLAAAIGFRSSWYPGLLLGIGCTLAARADSMPRINSRFVLKSVLGGVCITEFVAAFSGLTAHLQKHAVYPDEFYHALDVPRQVVAQTIQLTCYWMGALCACTLIGFLLGLRYGPSWSAAKTERNL